MLCVTYFFIYNSVANLHVRVEFYATKFDNNNTT